MNTSSVYSKDIAANWWNPYAIALVVYYFVMALAGLFVPEDVLKNHTWANEFSDFISSIVPQIDSVAALNIKPDVNRFYFSVLWAGSPIAVVIVLLWGFDAMKSGQATMWTTSFKKMVLPMVFGSVAIFGFLEVSWLVNSEMKLAQFTFGTIAGRAFLAQIFVLGPIFFGPGVAAWLIGWLTGRIPRNIQRMRSGPG